MTRVYLDHNATCPPRPESRAAMLDALAQPGNASSVHSFGRDARKKIETAREQVARHVNAPPTQIIFNSGATEGNNTILRHFAGNRILASSIEHSSILDGGVATEKIAVTPDGLVDLEKFEHQLKTGTAPALVSVMLVNNETGVIQPVAEIAKLAKAAGTRVHTDAVQAAGRIPVDFTALGVDYMTLSAHKIGGPQGVGALIIAGGAPIPHLLLGGGQERGARAGTQNVAGIAAFGAAADAALRDLADYQRLAPLRDKMEQALRATSTRVRIHGTGAPRVANTTALTVSGIAAETLLMSLDLEAVAMSSGSACSSGKVKPSHVLLAMGIPADDAACALRISSGWTTTAEDVDFFIQAWHKIATRLFNT